MSDLQDPEKLKHAKDHLISQTRAVYSPRYPDATFDVVIFKKYSQQGDVCPWAIDDLRRQEGERVSKVWAAIIVYPKDSEGEWKLIKKSAEMTDTFAAIDDLLDYLYKALELVVRSMGFPFEARLGKQRMDVLF